MISILIFLPSILLSGIMFPAGMLPGALEMAGKLFPASWGYLLMAEDTLRFEYLWPLLLIFGLADCVCAVLAAGLPPQKAGKNRRKPEKGRIKPGIRYALSQSISYAFFIRAHSMLSIIHAIKTRTVCCPLFMPMKNPCSVFFIVWQKRVPVKTLRDYGTSHRFFI